MVYTVVLDAPDEQGRAVVACFEAQLLVLPRCGSQLAVSGDAGRPVRGIA